MYIKGILASSALSYQVSMSHGLSNVLFSNLMLAILVTDKTPQSQKVLLKILCCFFCFIPTNE